MLKQSASTIDYAVNVIEWEDMKSLFRETKRRFGQADTVVANGGMMKSKGVSIWKKLNVER